MKERVISGCLVIVVTALATPYYNVLVTSGLTVHRDLNPKKLEDTSKQNFQQSY